MQQPTCESCHYYLAGGINGGNKGKGNCFLKPPVVQFVPMVVPVAQHKMALPSRAMPPEPQADVQFHPASAVPMVRAIDFCSSHVSRKNDLLRAWDTQSTTKQ